MNPADEVPSVLDVHPPHEPVHGWRDFLLHLFTITIGLEGCVEWQHHRHLVHEAEASLHAEIEGNANGLQGVLNDVHKQQADLKHDVEVLDDMIKNPKSHIHKNMSISFRSVKFDDVSWKTTQSTGALSYMSYDTAAKYAGIYSLQEELEKAQLQGTRDAVTSIGPILNVPDKTDPTPSEAQFIKEHIEIVQGQLILIESLVTGLDAEYKKFLTAHPA